LECGVLPPIVTGNMKLSKALEEVHTDDERLVSAPVYAPVPSISLLCAIVQM
jgi:hypothetical protein